MSTKYIYLCNSVWEVVSFEIVRIQANHVLASDTFRAIEIRGSSQFFEPDRIGTEAAGPCFLFLYYPTLTLSFLAKARRPQKRRQHLTDLGEIFHRPVSAASSLSLQIDKRQSERKEDEIEGEMKIT